MSHDGFVPFRVVWQNGDSEQRWFHKDHAVIGASIVEAAWDRIKEGQEVFRERSDGKLEPVCENPIRVLRVIPK